MQVPTKNIFIDNQYLPIIPGYVGRQVEVPSLGYNSDGRYTDGSTLPQ